MGSKEKQRMLQLGKLLICEVVIYFLEFTAYKSQVIIISLCNIFKRNYLIIVTFVLTFVPIILVVYLLLHLW